MKKLLIVFLLLFIIKVSSAQLFGSLASDDYDAARFCSSTYANITTPVQRDAINILTKDLKVYGLWNLDNAIYPMVGGNSYSHSLNLKNPSAYQITWIGSPTHNSYGVDFNGSGQWGNTNFNPTGVLSPSNLHFSYYTRDNEGYKVAYSADIGIEDNTTTPAGYYYMSSNMWAGNTDNRMTLSLGENTPISIYNPPDNSGYFIGSRTSSNNLMFFRNGTLLGTSSTTLTSTTLPNYSFGLAWCNPQNTWPEYSTKQCAFASIGSSYTNAQAILKTTIVNKYEIKLNRNIF